MSKILAVFGATGVQGSSVVNNVLSDVELSQIYKIRAITRDVDSEKAKLLKEKVEVVQGDVLDNASLKAALAGVNTVFLITTPDFSPDAFEIEYNNIKRVADIAVEQGVEYIIFSTLPGVKQISQGKYTAVTPFDAKAEGEKYIKSLPIKSGFVSLGSFMENFQSQPFLAPREAADGTWVLTRSTSSKARLPLISAVDDVGKFVGAILAEPDKFEGKTFCCAVAWYSIEDQIAAWSKFTGKKVVFKQVSEREFRGSLPLPGTLPEIFIEAFKYGDEFGYFGPGGEEAVEWAVKNARGKLTTLEEYLEIHPLQL